MGVDHYECTICGEVRHSDNTPIVYTCALTEEEINDPEFDDDVMDDRAFDDERVCIWCIKSEGIKKTVSGCYYYDAHDKLKQHVSVAAVQLARTMQALQRFKSNQCKECNKPMFSRKLVGLCGVCGESIHAACGKKMIAARHTDEKGMEHTDVDKACSSGSDAGIGDTGDGDGATEDAIVVGSTGIADSYSITVALPVYTCTACIASEKKQTSSPTPATTPVKKRKLTDNDNAE